MRHRVTVQRVAEVDDRYGGATQTWQDVSRRWAAVRQLSASEQFQRSRLEYRATHAFTMRWDQSLSVLDRLEWQGQIYVIRAINDPDGLHRWAEVDAESGVE